MNEDDLFKTFLQSQLYALDSVQISSREKAERLRHTMFFYHGLLSQGKISCETHQVLTSMLSSEYSSIVDSMRRPQGLTNYKDLFQFSSEEEEVIKNKFSQWESGLSLQDRQPVCSKTESDEVTVRINFSKLNSSEKLDHCSTSNKQNNVVNKQGGGLTTGEQKKVLNNNDISGIAPPVKREAPVFSKRKAYFQPHVSGPENTRPEKARLIDRNQPTKSIVYGNGNSSSKGAGQTNDENTTVECEGDNPFRTAGEQLVIAQLRNKNSSISSQNYGSKKRSLGTRRTGLSGKFVPPISQNENEAVNGRQSYHEEKGAKKNELKGSKYDACEWMKNIDERMIELIENEIMDHGAQVNWEDIAGLEFAKTTIQEIVIWPMLRPDIFTGLRGPPKGLLLFGPPGTGKTLIGKCIASQSNATFFSISASSLTSKWVGEGEKMVRALFGVARCHQPSVIFIDEIDSLLTSRSDNEHESSRRIKTEFLVQLDGATCTANERILVVGATNRPQELDEAARRRLVKRLYIPLPDIDARMQIVVNLLRSQDNETNAEDLNTIAAKTDGFSGADMATLCREAALGPIRTITDIRNIDANDVRPVNISDFEMALRHVRPSVSKSDLQVYVDWNSSYGSSGGEQ